MSTKSIFCRYQLYGYCNLGSQCAFSHDRLVEPSQICRYYLKGKCPYEKKCRYDHVKPSSLSNALMASSAASTSQVSKATIVRNGDNRPKDYDNMAAQHGLDNPDPVPSTSGGSGMQRSIDQDSNQGKNNSPRGGSALGPRQKSLPDLSPPRTEPARTCGPSISFRKLMTSSPVITSQSRSRVPDPLTKDQREHSGVPKAAAASPYLNLKPLFFQSHTRSSSQRPGGLEPRGAGFIRKPDQVLDDNRRSDSLLNVLTGCSRSVPSPGTAAEEFVHHTGDGGAVKEIIKNHVFNVRAKEFVPTVQVGKSYSAAVVQNLRPLGNALPQPDDKRPMCPYSLEGECRYGQDRCVYLHGEVCDICDKNVLHPTDTKQRDAHREQCLREIQMEMEFSFAVQLSEEKTCGICLDKVLEKDDDATGPDKRFGILPNCIHCYCLPCIMNWRKSKNQTMDNTIIRSCPECRVQSYFILPSKIWVEDKAEKAKMIEDYKKSLGDKTCKYFRHGAGKCPLNDICFYRHDYPDGTLAPRNVGSSGPRRRRYHYRDRTTSEHVASTLAAELMLWDFFSTRFEPIDVLGSGFEVSLRAGAAAAGSSSGLGDDRSEDDDDDDLGGAAGSGTATSSTPPVGSSGLVPIRGRGYSSSARFFNDRSSGGDHWRR